MDPLSPSPRLQSGHVPPQQRLATTNRTKLVRRPQRGSHERALFNAIVDEALVCHVGVVVDGSPRVLPTAHVRHQDSIYVHGAKNNHLMTSMINRDVAITVTLLDGLVLSRSVFSHSMNYRSAVVYGQGIEVIDLEEKRSALHALVEHIAAGRSNESRSATAQELESTLVVRVPIEEGSIKTRTGPPLDHDEDTPDTCWAGEIPLRLIAQAPRRDPSLSPDQLLTAALRSRVSELGLGRRAPYEYMAGNVLISSDATRIDFALVYRFLRDESYWAQGVTEERQRTAIEHALCIGLYRSGAQLGFARVVTDFARIAYVGDLFIVAHERGAGLGKLLMEAILAHPELAGVERWLLGTRDAHGLYERYGFSMAAGDRYMVRRS